MERVLTYEEKIRRAEEIYARRNRNNVGNVTRVNIRENKKKSVLKKMLLQMLICIGMYSIFYLINTTDYFFSENVKSNTKQILSYDVDLIKLYQDISEYVQGIINAEEPESIQEEIKSEENKEEQTEPIEQIGIDENQEIQKQEEIDVVEELKEETKPLSQMEIDANEIKQNYSLISPLAGIVSSEFGEREVNNELITPEHYGIDIAADEGVNIISAMEGEVVTATYSSSYRKFYKNSK